MESKWLFELHLIFLILLIVVVLFYFFNFTTGMRIFAAA